MPDKPFHNETGANTAWSRCGEGAGAVHHRPNPERDTADLLANYVPKFDSSFIGLRGDPAATAETAKEYKIFYQKVAGAAEGWYTMDHSAGTYVADAQGRLRLIRHGETAENIAQDLKALLAAG